MFTGFFQDEYKKFLVISGWFHYTPTVLLKTPKIRDMRITTLNENVPLMIEGVPEPSPGILNPVAYLFFLPKLSQFL